MSARLGKGNKGVQHVLREVHKQRQGWWEALIGSERSGYTVRIAERDEAGAHALMELRDHGIEIVADVMTHFFDLAESLYEEELPALFLRPERTEDGRRTFRIIEGEPLPTSYGEDIYHRVFADDRSVVAS